MQQYREDKLGSAQDGNMPTHNHLRAPTLFYHPAAGILSASPMPHPYNLVNTHIQPIPPYNHPPSSPVAPAACTFGAHAFQAPSFSEISTRLEGLQQRHFEAPATTHSRFQASRTFNEPMKRQRDMSDDEEGEEAVSRLRARGPPSAVQKLEELASSPKASYDSTNEMAMEDDGTDRDYNEPFTRQEYRQRPNDFEE
ncbi:hypothetical protein NADE_003565 [Nannochloris sp. 'desiccata']|nr:hypothetical protein KSW81_000411 [Chlorella desiccata (nom. nud.)]KAH7620956.1 hypothetical protein NADE_003565 [Chlorella desiccata (nom. nud.)]